MSHKPLRLYSGSHDDKSSRVVLYYSSDWPWNKDAIHIKTVINNIIMNTININIITLLFEFDLFTK